VGALLAKVFERAEADSIPPSEAADRIARERLASLAALRPRTLGSA
jgi:hypothetical protein